MCAVSDRLYVLLFQVCPIVCLFVYDVFMCICVVYDGFSLEICNNKLVVNFYANNNKTYILGHLPFEIDSEKWKGKRKPEKKKNIGI